MLFERYVCVVGILLFVCVCVCAQARGPFSTSQCLLDMRGAPLRLCVCIWTISLKHEKRALNTVLICSF